MEAKTIDIGGIQLYWEVSGENHTGPVIVFSRIIPSNRGISGCSSKKNWRNAAPTAGI